MFSLCRMTPTYTDIISPTPFRLPESAIVLTELLFLSAVSPLPAHSSVWPWPSWEASRVSDIQHPLPSVSFNTIAASVCSSQLLPEVQQPTFSHPSWVKTPSDFSFKLLESFIHALVILTLPSPSLPRSTSPKCCSSHSVSFSPNFVYYGGRRIFLPHPTLASEIQN